MTCHDCVSQLEALIDGELSAEESTRVQEHAAGCAGCRAQLASLRALVQSAAALPKGIPPSRDLWPELGRALTASASDDEDGAVRGRPGSAGFFRWAVPVGIAASVAMLAMVSEGVLRERPRGAPWRVTTVAGSPRIGTATVDGEATFRQGQWLETDEASRARVTVGSIGEVTLAPNSRLRLVGTAERDHRLELKRGTLDAFIVAPPRLFFVDTPSATAVDLGCAYTLAVDDAGNGELVVTAGFVALEYAGREAIIPWGSKCLTRRGAGPGTPFLVKSSETLQRALTRFDFEPAAAAAALAEVLSLARAEDDVTLWHLLARTKASDRAAVFDTLARLSSPPVGVTRAGILAGDRSMRLLWGSALGLRGLKEQ